MTLSIGDKIPDLTLAASGAGEVSFKKLAGKNVVIYFYPKDNTPGCTQEGQDFRDLHKQFQKAGTEIFGISKDSVKSHDNFVAKFEFPFLLLADIDGQACDAFGAIVEKSMYGRKYMGIDRCTWLFDSKGKLKQVWRGVKVKGHAAEVLEAAKAL